MSAGVETTYKARDVEEIIDIVFYRPIGYRVARAADSIRITPNIITVIGIVFGMVAGHFFLYEAVALNVLGMLLWVISNICDSADGQLARMTGQTSELGRILDGFGGNLVFASIYIHIALRYVYGDGPIGWWIFAVAVAAGISHSLQSSMADYYRNAFLRYGVKEAKGELDSAVDVKRRLDEAKERGEILNRLFLRLYLNYTRQQETFSPKFQVLREKIGSLFGASVPDSFADAYRRTNKPLLKYYNFMTINGRVLTLFGFVLIGYPTLFFVTEITLFNLLLYAVLARQERNNAELTILAETTAAKENNRNNRVAAVS